MKFIETFQHKINISDTHPLTRIYSVLLPAIAPLSLENDAR